MVDTHVHTCFSSDSKMTLPQALRRADELNMGLTLTEHMDLLYPEPEAFVFDMEQYFRAYERYRGSRLLLGVEIGMRPDCVEEYRAIAADGRLDYVIGSIHVVDGRDIYFEDFYRGRAKEDSYREYFGAMAGCLKSHPFIDSLGHIDYICRYARYADPEFDYRALAPYIDPVLEALAAQGKAIEINTRRLGDAGAVSSLLSIYRRFFELGGRLATIGSDAHKPEAIGMHFAAARELAARCGLKTVYYRARRPEYC